MKWIVEMVGSSSCTCFTSALTKEKVVGTRQSHIPFVNKPLFLIRQDHGYLTHRDIYIPSYLHCLSGRWPLALA